MSNTYAFEENNEREQKEEMTTLSDSKRQNLFLEGCAKVYLAIKREFFIASKIFKNSNYNAIFKNKSM